MNPKPFLLSNHLILPLAISTPDFQGTALNAKKDTTANPAVSPRNYSETLMPQSDCHYKNSLCRSQAQVSSWLQTGCELVANKGQRPGHSCNAWFRSSGR